MDEFLSSTSINSNLVGPTLPPIPPFTLPTGPTGLQSVAYGALFGKRNSLQSLSELLFLLIRLNLW